MPNNVAKFLESPCDSSGSRRACWQSKTFPGIPHIFSCISWHSNFAARLSCDFRKVVDIVVWIVSERRVIVHRCDLVELLGLITSCWRRTWPDSQTPRPRAECAWPELLGRENYAGSRGRQVKVSEVAVGSGLEVTVKEQQGRHKQRRVKHEKWEGESRETWHAHCRHPWAMHVCKTHKNVRSVRAVYVHQKMYVQQVSVCTLPVAHTVVGTTWVRTTVGTTPAARKSKKTEKIIAPWPFWEKTFGLPSCSFWSLSPGLGPLVCFPPIIRCMS